MGRIISSYIFPHPPIIVPQVGKGGENAALQTINAVKRAAAEIKKEKPAVIIITTPHGPVFQDYIYIADSRVLTGNLGRFGAPEVQFSFTNDLEITDSIIKYAKPEGIYSGGVDSGLLKKYGISGELDHGTTVPLFFVGNEYKDFKLVHISIAGLPYRQLYKFGMCISKAVADSGEDAVFIASGDLSHRLSHEAPYGYNKRGKEFDERLVGDLKKMDIEDLLEIDEDLCESAGQCGLRSFIMMFGAMDGYDLKPEVYSYEGPFGVGYTVAGFSITGVNHGRKLLERIEDKSNSRLQQIRRNEDPYAALARKTLEIYIKEKSIIKATGELPGEMLKNRAGTFVSIKKDGQLRGCIGTTGPTKRSIAEEIIHNAISSGTRDPRFNPVEEDELENLVYSVDVLNEAEPVESIVELDVKRYGVIVKSGMRSGLLLPDLEGVDTPEKQVSIALQKAGIGSGEKYSMERFEVIRHR